MTTRLLNTGRHLTANTLGNWTYQAACVEAPDPDVFYPPEGRLTLAQIVEAKSYCDRCPVRGPCLFQALKDRQRFGIWGGMTPHERARLARTST